VVNDLYYDELNRRPRVTYAMLGNGNRQTDGQVEGQTDGWKEL